MAYTKAEARRRRRRKTAIVLVILLAVLTGGIYLAVSQVNSSEVLVRERCTAVVGNDTYELGLEQAQNASLIVAVAVARGLPARAASIALATAVQESGLRNLDYGDEAGPDSRGLFQQRPSQGWGTDDQVQDPLYAAGAFYDALVDIPGYESLPITEAAQAVQRSALPDAYADHEAEGRAFASALTGNSPASLNCVLRGADEVGDPESVQAAAATAFGSIGSTVVDDRSLILEATGATGWAAAQWAVANAKALHIESVAFGGLEWTRAGHGWTAVETTTGQIRVLLAADDAEQP
ncbi:MULTISPECIES: hypothetical protein [unclassified Arthrobacter]|uniref:hypothetical protein n=1 Tax=unclassified Arthrobacter TaxID=235627 RepID=UPI00149135D3|nr:hypothetical protein [Arthrobacter sp. AET 35A]MBE0008915.1 hypothetical protein [Arthrobacter sp. AET 35A]NOJ58456.1 hypothetical protein [Arthrobacter sp. 260]NOJ62605.1 hypothetical protein [Arthrobacter sp. 147(2020)]